MKEAGEKMCQRIVELEKNSLQSDKFTYKVLDREAEINRIKQEINDDHAQVPLPYLIKEKCLTQLENLSKTIWLREKEIEKYVI